MTPEQFCYWLQGRTELLPDQPPTADEWKMIREHLALVFRKVTPERVGHPAITPVAPIQYQPLRDQAREYQGPILPGMWPPAVTC